MAVQLPDELIVEILSILPAKPLIRCRLVCKRWLSLINSTKFKLMHLHNFNQLNPRYLIRLSYEDKELYNVHLDDEDLTIDHGTPVVFPFSISRFNECFRIVGCCNGVVCLCDDDGNACSFDNIILWNPSIRRKLTLTVPSFYPIDFEKSYIVLGFGYDRISDDYKVVSLAYVGFLRPQVKVYSKKTGIWKEIRFPDDLSCFFILSDWSQVFFNGSVHWISCNPTPGASHSSIMTFDTSSEIFGQIMLPDVLIKVSANTMVISVVGESLSVMYSNRLRKGWMSSSTYTVWVMKEYNNPTSWTIIYNMHYPDMDMGKPLQLRNKGDMNMIIHSYSVYAFGKFPGYRSESEVDFRTYVDRYQESLAFLDVGDSLPNDE